MQNAFRTALYVVAIAAAVVVSPFGAAAQDQFPNKPIKFVVGFSPGGGFDTTARAIARAAKGVTIVVDNMGGASGRRAISYVARSKPDGYTIVLANMPMQLFYNMLGKDSFKLADFSWIAQAVTQDGIVVVKEDSPLKSVNDLKTLERFRLCMGGIAGHDGMSALVMQKTLGYKQPQFVTGYIASKAVPGLLKGECDVAVGVTNPLWADAVRSKKLRILAVFAPQRNPAFPDAPTFKEIGYPSLSLPTLVNHGFVAAPPGTPKEIVGKLESIVVKAMSDPATSKILESNGITTAPLGSAEVVNLVGQMEGLVKEFGPMIAPYVR
jgi:tripartite-type tricarboxylate transporter receptor subunit TctC